MKSVSYSMVEAAQILTGILKKTDTETVPLDLAPGRVLGEDLIADRMVPPFSRSPYDGYALMGSDTAGATEAAPVTLSITEEIRAGDTPKIPLTSGHAAKILTGAPVPPGCDAVVKYETTTFTERTMTLSNAVAPGSNVIPAGEDMQNGQMLLSRGAVIPPAASGVLAALGRHDVCVHRKPAVALICTGDELIETGEPLPYGKIYNTSRYTIASYLESFGCRVVHTGTAPDNAAAIADTIARYLPDVDIIVTTGGVSVGDYDKVPEAQILLGAAMPLGDAYVPFASPSAISILEDKLLLGLSGNPGTAAVTMLTFGAALVRHIGGRQEILPREIRARLTAPVKSKKGRTQTIRGSLSTENGALCFTPVGDYYANGVISSLVHCNALGTVPVEAEALSAGEWIAGYELFI